MAAMLKVNQAIRMDKQISFRYQKFTIKDRTQQVDRRGGATYKISPFKLIINDGFYCQVTPNQYLQARGFRPALLFSVTFEFHA